MRCDKANYQLQLYIDRQLTLKQMRQLEEHLISCLTCRTELEILENLAASLNTLKFIPEPPDMHAQIMQKVALTTIQKQSQAQSLAYSPFRPSLVEILAAAALATVATLAILLQQPFLRSILPIANGHDSFSRFYTQAVHMLTSIDTNTLSLALWIVGTVLGICITLIVAGNEMRSQWFKAMLERLPVR